MTIYGAAYLVAETPSHRLYLRSKIEEAAKYHGLTLARVYEDERLSPPALDDRSVRPIYYTREGVLALVSDALSSSWEYVIVHQFHGETSFDPKQVLESIKKTLLLI